MTGTMANALLILPELREGACFQKHIDTIQKYIGLIQPDLPPLVKELVALDLEERNKRSQTQMETNSL